MGELIKKVNSQMKKYVPCSVFVEHMQGAQEKDQQLALAVTCISDMSIAFGEKVGEEDVQNMFSR